MRRYLLILFMLLLPLRGWAGDAMALASVPVTPAHAAQAGAAASGSVIAHGHPCHGEAAAPAAAGEKTAAPAPTGDHFGHGPHGPHASEAGAAKHAGCNACDLCHGSALLAAAAPVCALAPAAAQHAPRATPFASALLAGNSKPPIS